MTGLRWAEPQKEPAAAQVTDFIWLQAKLKMELLRRVLVCQRAVE